MFLTMKNYRIKLRTKHIQTFKALSHLALYNSVLPHLVLTITLVNTTCELIFLKFSNPLFRFNLIKIASLDSIVTAML